MHRDQIAIARKSANDEQVSTEILNSMHLSAASSAPDALASTILHEMFDVEEQKRSSIGASVRSTPMPQGDDALAAKVLAATFGAEGGVK